jgi:hypothetical protein
VGVDELHARLGKLVSAAPIQVAEKVIPEARIRTTGAEVRQILKCIRGAEAPLFHGRIYIL